MSFLGDIGGFLGGMVGGPVGAGIGKGLGEFGGSALGFGQSQDNRNREIEASDYQKSLNAQTMAREDNAVQRRVADLKAAGLSPVLAAGSPASSASFRSGEAPKTSVMDNIIQSSAIAMQGAQTREATARATIAEHDAEVIRLRPNTLSTDPWQARLLDQSGLVDKGKAVVNNVVNNPHVGTNARKSWSDSVKDRWLKK